MFWIPIAAIIIFIWMICYAVNSARAAQFDREHRERRNAERSLAESVTDEALESDLNRQLEGKYEECRRIVREFMGGGGEWSVYADYLSGKKKALLVSMARCGRLPRNFVISGDTLPLVKDSFSPKNKDGQCLTPERGREMNEEFILRVEEYLNTRFHIGVQAVVSTWRYDGQDNRLIRMPLREFLGKYGSGSTNYTSEFQFVRTN